MEEHTGDKGGGVDAITMLSMRPRASSSMLSHIWRRVLLPKKISPLMMMIKV